MTTDTETQIAPRETTDTWTELDRLFDDLHRRFLGSWNSWPFGAAVLPFTAGSGRPSLRAARADITDTGTAFKVTADLPGIPKDKLEIHVSGTSVEIRGETEQNAKKAENGYLHRERHYAGFYRALELPEPVVAKDATAKLENGVLELELPKEHPTPSPEPVRVPVQ